VVVDPLPEAAGMEAREAIYSVSVSPVSTKACSYSTGIAQAEVVVSSVYLIDPTEPEAEEAASVVPSL